MSQPVVRVVPVADVRLGSGPLPAPEAARCRRLVQPEDQASFHAAHVLVRHVAADLLGLPESAACRLVLEQSCPVCGGTDHGRPSIAGHPDVHVSLSRARGVVAALAASSPCGIDVETYRAGGVPPEALTVRERSWVATQPDPNAAATLLWTRKEAWAKATGSDLDTALAEDLLDPGRVTGELRSNRYAAAWVVL